MERSEASDPEDNAKDPLGEPPQNVHPQIGGTQSQVPSATLTSSGRPASVATNDSGAPPFPTNIRGALGYGTSRISDFVNDNLIVVRLVTAASIASLAMYGISHTALFLRFRNVSEIPSKYFVERRRLSCRIMSIDRMEENRSVILWVRHLSPVERLCFSKSWFEWFVSIQPSSLVNRHTMDHDPSQLLKVRVAGVQWPPYQWEDGWLDRMVAEKRPVKCECLARMVPETSDHEASNSSLWDNGSTSAATAETMHIGPVERKKRPIPGISSSAEALARQASSSPHQDALCKIFFRSHEGFMWSRLFGSSDLALSMVRSGRAVARDAPLTRPSEGFRSLHTSNVIRDLQRDATYVKELSHAEQHAAYGFLGIWSDTAYRETRADVIEEIDFQATASLFRKFWRWIRGG